MKDPYAKAPELEAPGRQGGSSGTFVYFSAYQRAPLRPCVTKLVFDMRKVSGLLQLTRGDGVKISTAFLPSLRIQ